MITDHIPTAFSMLIEEFDRTLNAVNKEGAQAFAEKNYDLVTALTAEARRIDEFQSRIVALEDEWASSGVRKEDKTKKGTWKKSEPTTPVAFHASCLQVASKYLHQEFVKQTRSSYISKDLETALVCAISREHDNGTSRFFWFAFHPYQEEFLASKKRAYLLLGCGSPNVILLIPYSDFATLTKKLNKTEREDTYYSHIRIVSLDGKYDLKLEGRGNRVDVTKYLIPQK